MGEPVAREAEQLDEWIAGERFSCLAAKAALRRETLCSIELCRLASEETTTKLHAALTTFVESRLKPDENFATLVAVFDAPRGLSEQAFDVLLWEQLAALHEVDVARGYSWAREVAADPASTKFAFSVAEHPFFVVGMHDNASRISRRFPRPALAFNSHRQFQRLKANGVYSGLQRRIRQRELRLQRSINPNLAEFGEASEARQYAGLATDARWRCPFHPRPNAQPDQQGE